mmetsp:Transcript_309/g.665  ORF Transcript_309/g.665 Transcript_309/m.665 type:complete len:88 (-) Transcript_309:176-439(-)
MGRDPMTKDSQQPRRAADATSAPEYVIRGNLGKSEKEGRSNRMMRQWSKHKSKCAGAYLADTDRDLWTKRPATIPSPPIHTRVDLGG